MKALSFNIPITDDESFIVRKDAKEYFYATFHSHKEIQITLILESDGSVCIGDYIGRYSKNDLFIIGSNCPHVFKNDPAYEEVDFDINPRAVSVYLGEYFWDEKKFTIPELSNIQKFHKKSKQVYHTNLSEDEELVNSIMALASEKGLQKYLSLISILDRLTALQKCHFLLENPFENHLDEEEGNRLKRVYEYTLVNSDQKISIQKVADIANLSPNAFCRFFKKGTGKTYADFLKSVRINNSAKLLISTDKSVSQIAEISGYHNISNFNRQFLKLKSETPLQYRKRNQET